MNSLIYISFLITNLGLIRLSENERFSHGIKLMLTLLLYLIIFLFGVLRFDVGNDYYNYSERFYGIINYNVFVTPDYFIFKILSNLFSSFNNGYIIVIGLYYVFTISVFLKFLKKKNVLFWGFFTLLTFGFYFDIFDRIRQLAAISIFILSIDDIKKNNTKAFIIKIIIAALFHASAIIILPFFFVSKVKLSNKVSLLIYFLLFLGFFLGLWKNILIGIYDNIPYYNEIYRNSKYYGNTDELSTSIGFIGKTIFILINILFSPIHERLKTLLLCGLILTIIGVGDLNVERVADYFLIITIYSFPLLLKRGFKRQTNKNLIVLPIILFLIILFAKDINQEYFRYQTVFSYEYDYQIFKNRVYD